MNEKYISTEQGKVYYWVSEKWDTNNDTLFFFHGLTADHTMFDKQTEYFDNKFNLIVWDAPCHGKSRPYSNFSFENTRIFLKFFLKHPIFLLELFQYFYP